MSYPDVVIASINNQMSLEAFRAIDVALVEHDKNSNHYSLVVDLSPLLLTIQTISPLTRTISPAVAGMLIHNNNSTTAMPGNLVKLQ